MRALEGGSAVLKDLTGKTTADEVANVMDNLADVSLNPIPAIHNQCCKGGRVVGFVLQLSEMTVSYLACQQDEICFWFGVGSIPFFSSLSLSWEESGHD